MNLRKLAKLGVIKALISLTGGMAYHAVCGAAVESEVITF